MLITPFSKFQIIIRSRQKHHHTQLLFNKLLNINYHSLDMKHDDLLFIKKIMRGLLSFQSIIRRKQKIAKLVALGFLFECCICFNVGITKKPCCKCNARYHISCWNNWVDVSKNKTCPFCRGNVHKIQTKGIYLPLFGTKDDSTIISTPSLVDNYSQYSNYTSVTHNLRFRNNLYLNCFKKMFLRRSNRVNIEL